MALIKVKTPAKINLTLEMVERYPNGFHKIQSIMAALNLYDYLSFDISDKNNENEIILNGNNKNIPYNEKNLVYKAAKLFLDKTKIQNKSINVYIEKNIPIEAGLAGGSTNAAGTFLALNEFFDKPLNEKELHALCAELGSDLNFCLVGGCCFCEGRGEQITKLKNIDLDICLIKPKTFGISTKEAYQKFELLKEKPKAENTILLKNLIEQNKFDEKLLANHLEMATIDNYPILQEIKRKENTMMSGSGPTMFCLKKNIDTKFDDDILVIENLKTIPNGVEIVK